MGSMLTDEDRKTMPPIYGTDFSKPLSALVEGLRNQIVRTRGQLSDISFRYPGWGEELKNVEGLLTCGLVALYRTMTEMQKLEAERAKAEASS